MPKEQIRKRGRRKPKEEDFLKPKVEVSSEVPVATPVVESAAPQAGPSGLHPDRVALLSGRRPAPAPRAPNESNGEGPNSASVSAEGEEQGDQPQQPWGRVYGLNEEFPFGELDPDLKGYFRTVEDQIKDWEGTSSAGEQREDRQNFLTSVLSELRGHELKISTDPDTAVILERLLPSLGDWGRRVIGDAFGGQWELMLKHRFGSHVVQTWLTLAADTLDREEWGVYPPQQAEQDERVEVSKKAKSKSNPKSKKDRKVKEEEGAGAGEGVEEQEGVLPKMTELVKSLVDTIQPNLAMMLTNPFASPPVRLLWLVISPDRALPTLDGSTTNTKGGGSGNGNDGGMIRSKKSNKYRKGQGVQGKSIFGDDTQGKGKGKGKEEKDGRRVDKELIKLRKIMRKGLMEKLGGADWRVIGVNSVGCPVVQLLLEFEVEDGHAMKPNSLLDHLTEGAVTSINESGTYESQPYLVSLLTLPTGTRLFETILLRSPQPVFDRIWSTYFIGKIGKLAIHPMSNFVVAKAIERLDELGVERVVNECKAVSGGRGMIKNARTSVLQALVERSRKLDSAQQTVLGLIRSAVHLPEDQDKALVPCLMTLNTYPLTAETYNAVLTGGEVPTDDTELPEDAIDQKAEDEAKAMAARSAWENRRTKPRAGAGAGELVPNMQGCLLLQSLAQLPIANEVVLQSLIDQPLGTITLYARSPISSHLLDIVLISETVPTKYRRRLINILLPLLKDLLDDKIGSRVAEKVWESADGYTKEKIARELLPHAMSIGASQYGRFIHPRLQFHLLERRPDEWRASVIGVKHHFAHQKAQAHPAGQQAQQGTVQAVESTEDGEEEGRKRKKDEIDELFEGLEEGTKKPKRR